MIYTNIRIDFKYGPKERFYRVILVKEDINLFNLGVGLGLALGAEFEHCFLITERNLHKEYVMAVFMENPVPGSRYLANYTLNDLGDKFCYKYDTGDGWDFMCKKYKRKVELDSKEDIIVLTGAGQGIWEDNIRSLYALFSGEISPLENHEDENKGIYLPWNFEIEKFGDFDMPLDLEELNQDISMRYKRLVNRFLKEEKAYIKENNIDISDFDCKGQLKTNVC